jgi:Rubrerythrin
MPTERLGDKAVGRSPKEVYRQFVEFEEKAAAIYLRLASHFSSSNRKLSALWLEMAMEEKQHAGLMQFCANERMYTGTLPSETDTRKFSALFRKLEKRAADRDIDVNLAFEIAAELEGSEVNAIYCHLTTPLHSSSYLLKRKIVSSPLNHLDHLVAAGKTFRVSASTMKKLASLTQTCPHAWF